MLPASCRLSSAVKHSDEPDSGRGLQECRHCAMNQVALWFLSMHEEVLTEIMIGGDPLWKSQMLRVWASEADYASAARSLPVRWGSACQTRTEDAAARASGILCWSSGIKCSIPKAYPSTTCSMHNNHESAQSRFNHLIIIHSSGSQRPKLFDAWLML